MRKNLNVQRLSIRVGEKDDEIRRVEKLTKELDGNERRSGPRRTGGETAGTGRNPF